MSVLKVPLTLQSLSGKEENNPHKNLASHAAKIMRDEEAPQIRPSAYRHLREILFRLQLQRVLQCLQLLRELQHGKALLKDGAGGKEEEEMQDWIEPEDQRGQLHQRQTIPERQEPIRQRLSTILQTEV